MIKSYKIKARRGKGDKWQEFTGVKKTVMEEMVDHCYESLNGMAYEFGIFSLERIFNERLCRDVVVWVLRKKIRI